MRRRFVKLGGVWVRKHPADSEAHPVKSEPEEPHGFKGFRNRKERGKKINKPAT